MAHLTNLGAQQGHKEMTQSVAYLPVSTTSCAMRLYVVHLPPLAVMRPSLSSNTTAGQRRLDKKQNEAHLAVELGML